MRQLALGWGQAREAEKRTVVAAVGRVVERIALLAVVFARGSRGLAHLLLAVGLEVDLIHGEGWVAQVRHDGQGARVSGACWDERGQAEGSSWTAWCRREKRSAQ